MHLTRRTFLRHCVACAGAMNLTPLVLRRLEAAVGGKIVPIVLWLPTAKFVAQEPDIELAPDSLVFAPTAVGTHADLALDIRNIGAADLHVHSLGLVGLNKTGYSLVSPPAIPFTISPLTGTTVTVRFTPTLPRSYDYARLAVGSNDPDEPVVELALSGSGMN